MRQTRLRRQIELTADPALIALLQELETYPAPQKTPALRGADGAEIAVPLRLRLGERELAFFSTVTVFGTPLDITLSELAVEAFFPADAATATALRAAAPPP